MPTIGRAFLDEPMERLVPCKGCGSAHPKDFVFYVTCRRHPDTPSQLVAWLLGPYDTHAEALAQVDRGRGLADKADPRTVFDAFGTAGARRATPITAVFGR